MIHDNVITLTHTINPLKSDSPLLFAHRGSSLLAPENTFQAFDIGLQTSADVLEIDVRISRDEKVVVIHDEQLDRTTNGSGAVLQHTLKQIKKLDAGYRFQDRNAMPFRGKKIQVPTLLEVYQAYPHMIVNIDIKDKMFRAARLLAQTIEAAGAEHRTVVASFHGKILRYFRKLSPQVATSATFSEVLSLYVRGLRGLQFHKQHQCVALQIPRQYASIRLDTERFIQAVHQTGRSVHYWTVNDTESMRLLLSLGADGIVTDRPDLALKVFQDFGFK